MLRRRASFTDRRQSRQQRTNRSPHRSSSFQRRGHSPAFRLNNPIIKRVSISPQRQQPRVASKEKSTKTKNSLRIPHAKWVGERFVREQGFFRGWKTKFWMYHPFFVTWYNSFYPIPLALLETYEPLVIPPEINTRNQQTLESFIIQREKYERRMSTAPQDPNARLVPNFSQHLGVLYWALPQA